MKIKLFVGGERKKVGVEEAEAILGRFQRQSADNDVFGVDLSCRQWPNESIDIILPFLSQIAGSIEIVGLADVIAGLMTDEGLEVTEKLSKTFEASNLIEIDLSDNAMGPRGLERVDTLFANASLQRLYLSNCGLSAESMNMLKAYFSNDDGRIANSLTDLVLDKNMIGVGGAKIVGEFLATCKNLQYFSYNGCRPGEEGTKYICDGLHNLTKDNSPVLRRIDLEDCTFGSGEDEDDAIFPLTKALEKCSLLTRLNITDGALELGGIELLVNALQASRALPTHLYLDGMGELGSEGAQILSDFFKKQATNLSVLHLNYNELGDEGVTILLEPFGAVKNCLTELSLTQNEIEENGATALVCTSFPMLQRLILEENDDMPKTHLKKKYGDKVVLDDDEDDEDIELSADIDILIDQLNAASL